MSDARFPSPHERVLLLAAVRRETLTIAARVDAGDVSREALDAAWRATGDAEPRAALAVLRALDREVGLI